MKQFLTIAGVLLCVAASALGQARTAEAIYTVPFSQLDPTGRLPNGTVRYVSNGAEGTSPCTGGSTGSFAIKVSGVWQCPRLSPGAGLGDVIGPNSATAGSVAIYASSTGKNLASLSGTGFVQLTSNVASVTGSSGTGSVILSNSATLNSPSLLTPSIASFINAQHGHTSANTGGQLNASSVFSSGTIPPARIISNALTPNKCLRLSSGGAIETAADDCGTGSGGGSPPGGVSGNLQFNDAGVHGGVLNSAYNSATGRLTLSQKMDGADTLYGLRFTDTSPTGNWLRLRNAADTSDLFSVSVAGQIYSASTLLIANTTAPATPSAGRTIVWTDATDKNLKAKDDSGQVTITLRATACSGSDKVSGISAAGVVTCTADQTTPAGGGITSLNGLSASSQTFANDTNVGISSATSTHTITWTGTLAKARQNAATVYSDAGNTWTTGAQSFAAATSLTIPTAAGASPTASAQIAYDSTSNSLEYGENGTNRTVANLTGTQTFSNKTLDNSTTLNVKDTLFTLQDNADATKTVNFELGGITTATNRVVTIANGASVTVQPTTATANQWVTNIDSAGVQQKSQPSFTNISGSLLVTQGSTGQTAVAQGDLLYGDAPNSWARLAKSTSATRYLSNTGASNNPAWAQVDLTNGVTGLLAPANWSPLTTKGDLIVYNGTTTTRHAVGTNGFALIADSTQPNGIRWGAITATAGGSSSQLQYNSAGSLAGISGATTNGTVTTFAPASIVIGNISTPPTPVLGALFVLTSDGRLYYGIDGSTWGEVFIAGSSVLNLASTNVTGVLPVANGGTGFSDTTFSGNTHKLATTTGTLTSGRCVEIDASGNFVQAAAACGAGGSGTINSGVTNIIPKYTASTILDDSLLSDDGTTLSYSGTGGLALTGGTGAGYIQLTEGTAASLVANTVQHAAASDAPAGGVQYLWGSTAAASGILRVANSAGVMTVTQDAGISHLASSSSADLRGVLSDESGTGAAIFAGGNIGAGSATTAAANDNSTLISTTAYVQTELTAYASDSKTLTNTTIDVEATGNVFLSTHKTWLPFAGCNNATASHMWDVPTSNSPTAECVTGTNTQKGVVSFPDSDGDFNLQNSILLPADWTGTIDAKLRWYSTTATSGDVVWQLQTACVADGETDDPSWNTASTVTDTAKGTVNQMNDASITGVTITGCAAGEMLHVRVLRNRTHASDTITGAVKAVGLEITTRSSK